MCLVACCVSLFVHLGVLSRVKNIHTQFYYGQYVTLGAIRVHHVVHVLVCVFVIRGHLRIVSHGSHMVPQDSICKELSAYENQNADQPHPRYYLYTPPDYRHTVKHLHPQKS